jgi:hypothetical protein
MPDSYHNVVSIFLEVSYYFEEQDGSEDLKGPESLHDQGEKIYHLLESSWGCLRP